MKSLDTIYCAAKTAILQVRREYSVLSVPCSKEPFNAEMILREHPFCYRQLKSIPLYIHVHNVYAYRFCPSCYTHL